MLTALASLVLPAAVLAAPAQAASNTPSISTLVGIRTGIHQGYDRVVFDFTGPVPREHTASYVSQLRVSGSGQVVPIAGVGTLKVTLRGAQGHDEQGKVTYGLQDRAVDLANVTEIVTASDVEGILAFGIGVSETTDVNVFTLQNPARVVVDVKHSDDVERGSIALLDSVAYRTGATPSLVSVERTLDRPANARSALHRLFAGPTLAEYRAGLRFVDSGATGFTGLAISGGVARVQLAGGCASKGSTFTVADHLQATLKAFASVRWVKVLDPRGATGSPTGRSDSIPTCLEP